MRTVAPAVRQYGLDAGSPTTYAPRHASRPTTLQPDNPTTLQPYNPIECPQWPTVRIPPMSIAPGWPTASMAVAGAGSPARPAGQRAAGRRRPGGRHRVGRLRGRTVVGLVAGAAGGRRSAPGRRSRPRPLGARPGPSRGGRVRTRTRARRRPLVRHRAPPASPTRRPTIPTPPTSICSATARSFSSCRPRGCTPARRRWRPGCWRRQRRRSIAARQAAIDELRGRSTFANGWR